MTIWEIDQAMQNLVDENGELLDFEAFSAFAMERDRKLENMACWIVNLEAEAKAIREQERVLAERRQAGENRAKRLRDYLAQALDGAKFQSPRVAVSYRRSSAVETDEGFVGWAKEYGYSFLRYKEPEVDKTSVKAFLESGNDLPFARIVSRESLVIR